MASSLYAACDWKGFVYKKAFRTSEKNSWSRRHLSFLGEPFSLSWAEKDGGPAKHTWKLDPHDVTYLPVDEHRRSYEVKVSSGGSSFYFCPESADAQNFFLTRMDAARRLKVASVEQRGAVFRSENHVVSLSVPGGEAHPKLFSWGVGALLGTNAEHVDGISVPQKVASFRAA